jgi:hypothetical protein
VWIAGTAIAAVAERWWFPGAWDERSLQASRFYFGDTRAFLNYAAALSAGEPFDNGVPFHPPGWPWVLSVLFRVFGWSAEHPPDPMLLKHVMAAISGASVALAAWLAYVLAGRGVMIATSLVGVFHFGHVIQAAAPNSEPLYGLLLVAVLLGAVTMRRHSWAVGALAGFTALVRAEFLLSAALVAVWLAFNRRRGPRPGHAVLYSAGLIVALLPTTVLHWRSISDFNRTHSARMPGPLPTFAPVTGYGAFAFANANHGRADGGFNWDLIVPNEGDASRLEQGQLDLAAPAVYRIYVDGYRVGADWLWSHPREAIALMGKKLAISLSVFDYGYLLDNVPGRVQGVRRPVDQIDLATSLVTIAHATLTLIGVGLALAQPGCRILTLPLLTFLVSSLLFFGYVRLGVAYLPVLWILQALAVTRLLSVLPVSSRWLRRAELLAAAVGILLLSSEYSAAQRQRVLLIDGLVDEDGRLVEDQKVELTFIR